MARKKESQSLDIDEQLMISQDIEDESILFGDQEEISDETGKASGEEEENKKIFIELNRIVVQDQIYLSSELAREDLAQLVHLNNARFARMIKECTGTNFNGYINDLRIDYAIKLLDNHIQGYDDNSRKIWAIYAFCLWNQIFIENRDIVY